MKKKVVVFLIALLVFSSSLTYALNVEQILNKLDKKVNPKTAEMDLKIKTDSSDKIVEYFSKETAGQTNTLFKVLAPNEEEGTAVLALNKDSREELYFYIQAIGARKVAVNQKKGSFLQTEYNYFEILDMFEGHYEQKFQAAIEAKSDKDFVLRLEPKNDLNQYDYLLLHITNKYLPEKIEFYRGKQKYKVWQVEKFNQTEGVYYPEKSVLLNLNNNRETEITFTNVKYNLELNDMLFSVRYLKR
ncbi:outer membrane lipoprotein-sorting protein [Halanaerobacter jeridensis]|uniref:Outer membrane lipoprotein-sorting protein n=1 Tax=Halanaerobacter jeridensis TaxID=706427 RepID=A0A938XTP0_9FIRM|nr:outer membrane lipoprotein-sorting protein [Halanaerobacter jeridensis]MBM7557343.1 outer membrane lipoprotein-sorting protein [Halanaerobacter jeridensis]